jgi:general secretion pathway protein J
MADQYGFTLVDVLVLAGLLARQGWALTANGLRLARERIAAAEEVAAAQALVRRVIAEARPEIQHQEDGRVVRAFAGWSDRLRLVADLPPGSGQTSVLEMRLENGALVAVQAPHDPTEGQPFRALVRGQRVVLVPGVASARFSYWGQDEAWMDRWPDFRHPPHLVRLRLSFPPGDARRWPELVAAPVSARGG